MLRGAAPGPEADAGTELPAAEIFAPGQVLEYHLTMTEENWTFLEEHGDLEEYVPAAFTVRGGAFGEVSLGEIGVRHKGNWTLHHCWDENGGVRNYSGECAKLSIKLSFNEYDANGRLFGLKKLNLHASSGDSTKLHELLGYATYAAFGVDAPRAVPARVFINGELQGLFLAVENIDGRYTAFHFPDGGNGNLYKEVWPRAGMPNAHFAGALETNNDTSTPDVSDMQGFSAAVGRATEADFAQTLQPWVDIEALLRYMAVDRAIKNWDGVTAFYSPHTSHNFYFYHDDGPENRFHLIPWDLDGAFWDNDPYMDPSTGTEPVPNFNVQPASCLPVTVWSIDSGTAITPPGCDPLLRMLAKTQWPRFVELGNELLGGPLSPEVTDRRVADWIALMDPVIAEDPTLSHSQWRSAANNFSRTLTQLRRDFQALLAEGYRVQQPEEPLPEPTEEEMTRQGPESGILVGQVTNYEFTGGTASSQPSYTYGYASTGTTYGITWNRTSPIGGSADLRLDFTFARLPGAWDEYIGLGVATDGWTPVDISAYRQISITMKADQTRSIRIRVHSPHYDSTFGGAWAEFGMDLSVGPTPTTVKLPLARLTYPSWARDAWIAGQGWTTSDAEARALVLQSFDGLIFGPAPSTGPSGDMAQASETGYLQVDNIYFQ